MSENPETPELCYICAEAIDPKDRDMDHVLPRGLFNIEDRKNLITLPTHRACNGSFAKDDEYFRLQITARAPHDPKARRLWGDPLPGTGPVMRGLDRPESRRFKMSVLNDLIPVDVETESGIYLGSGEMMLQKADRITGVVNRMVRGLYTHRTGKVLAAGWPVSCDLMDGAQLEPMLKPLNIRFFSIGNGTVLYDSKHLADDDREALFWLIFYNSVHFWGYIGTQIRSRLPW